MCGENSTETNLKTKYVIRALYTEDVYKDRRFEVVSKERFLIIYFFSMTHRIDSLHVLKPTALISQSSAIAIVGDR